MIYPRVGLALTLAHPATTTHIYALVTRFADMDDRAGAGDAIFQRVADIDLNPSRTGNIESCRFSAAGGEIHFTAAGYFQPQCFCRPAYFNKAVPVISSSTIAILSKFYTIINFPGA